MRVLITSDVHGNKKLFDKIIAFEKSVDIHINLGDFLLDYNQYPNVLFVKGNCDYNSSIPEELRLKIDDKDFLFLHGHTKKVKNGLEQLLKYCTLTNVDYCVYGHTHFQAQHTYKNIKLINAGVTYQGEYLVIDQLNLEFKKIE